MIDVDGITKTYGDIVAVDNVSFGIEKGEIVGLLGPNGAGKTTAMRIITGYLHPDRGNVTVAGFDTMTNSLEARRYMGYLPEFSPLYNDMSVRKYLEFIAGTRDLSSETAKEQIEKIADRTGIEDQLDRPIAHLSKGYKQRVGLTQALLHDPEFLILDEPTTGLDPNQILDFRELIREVGQEHTVLLSTHILQEVTALCNRILIIHNGKIAADGSQEELREKHGENSIQLTVSAPDNGSLQEVKSTLEGQSYVTSVSSTERPAGRENGHTARYKIRIRDNNPDEVGEQLYGLARDENWRVSEISPQRPSLEQIFARLTQQESS